MKNGCKYCIAKCFNDAWAVQPVLNSQRSSSNLNSTLPIDDLKRHDGFTVKIKDHGFGLNVNEETPEYIEYVNKYPATLEICSEEIGKKLFPSFSNCPLIIEIIINYCPICGRKLGVIPMDK